MAGVSGTEFKICGVSFQYFVKGSASGEECAELTFQDRGRRGDVDAVVEWLEGISEG